MRPTQLFLTIEDIKDHLVLLKDGGVSLILQTSAVNFGLLSEEEQQSIIISFAATLNSLSFPIQIVIRSKRLDVSFYLTKLAEAQSRQTNPKLESMMGRYQQFVQSIIKENEVLDKKFFVCINVTNIELGIFTKNLKQKLDKANIILTPRRDHLIKQLARIGLKSRQLSTMELIKLFYDIYNDSYQQPASIAPTKPATLTKTAALFQPTPVTQPPLPIKPINDRFNLPPQSSTLAPPFIVEELSDEYGL